MTPALAAQQEPNSKGLQILGSKDGVRSIDTNFHTMFIDQSTVYDDFLSRYQDHKRLRTAHPSILQAINAFLESYVNCTPNGDFGWPLIFEYLGDQPIAIIAPTILNIYEDGYYPKRTTMIITFAHPQIGPHQITIDITNADILNNSADIPTFVNEQIETFINASSSLGMPDADVWQTSENNNIVAQGEVQSFRRLSAENLSVTTDDPFGLHQQPN